MNRRWIERAAQPVVVGVVPTLLLGLGIWRFMSNHIFARAPYILDTGLLARLVYRDGVLLAVPHIACNYADSFYELYVSPLTSLFSAVSYVVPIQRLEWFTIVQAAVYAPLGAAVYLIASRFEPGSALRRLPVTFAAAVAFAFSGFTLSTVGFPHFEVAMPAFACLMLGAIVTGRTRLAWTFLALTAAVRQDGGFVAATTLLPLLYLSWRGVEMRPTRKRLAVMFGVAIGASVVAMVVQKLVFHPFPRLTQAYLGDPPYAHLTWSLLAARAEQFLDINKVIYFPFIATVAVAAIRRDARYLLGWAGAAPWFVFDFTAIEESKAQFFAYGLGPFMMALLWVYLYGAQLAPAARRPRAIVLEGAFVVVCLASTFGAYRSHPTEVAFTARDMAVGHHINRAKVHAFVEALHDHRASLGRLRIDGPVATLAIEYVDPGEIWNPGATDIDALAFHIEGPAAMTVLGDLLANHLDACAHVKRTGLYLCTHDRLPPDVFAGLEIEVVPPPFISADFITQHWNVIEIEDRGIAFQDDRTTEGWLGILPRGTYEWTFTLEPETPVTGDLARLEVVQGQTMLAVGVAPNSARELRVRFDADGGEQPLAFRFRALGGSLVVTTTQLRRIATDHAATP
ncbi:MAG TPA: hypothetical protein VMJ10_25760 [Kofleriaceae bacterium]|nr:hypothetical protein [Kofleriaceae bacterium]